jgi:signal transduction histidine kinase
MKGGIKVAVSFDSARCFLIVRVSDTGIGISEADQSKLFKLFGKLSATTSINTSGIGLGLNICKKIVESFGGEINVQSTPGSGSTFSFTFRIDSGKNENEYFRCEDDKCRVNQ